MGDEDKASLKVDTTWIAVGLAAGLLGAYILARKSCCSSYDSIRAVPLKALCAELARRI